jgi:hypothetical protein
MRFSLDDDAKGGKGGGEDGDQARPWKVRARKGMRREGRRFRHNAALRFVLPAWKLGVPRQVALYLTAVRERSVRRSWEYPYLIFDIIAHIWF